MNDSSSPRQANRSRFPLLGTFLLTLGATLVGVFLTRQLKEAGSGHTYHEFIVGGAILAAMGAVIVTRKRRMNNLP